MKTDTFFFNPEPPDFKSIKGRNKIRTQNNQFFKKSINRQKDELELPDQFI